MDDLVVHGAGYEHVCWLEQVLRQIQDNSLTFREDKYQLGVLEGVWFDC